MLQVIDDQSARLNHLNSNNQKYLNHPTDTLQFFLFQDASD